MDVTRDIAAPPEEVWTQFASTRQWPVWGPSIRDVRPVDAMVHEGMRGFVTTVVGLRLPFEVTTVEPGTRWSWRVAGIAATDHRVVATDAGCRATIGVPAWAPFYLPVCRLALRRIAAAAEADRTRGQR